jgi:hypothetical protein
MREVGLDSQCPSYVLDAFSGIECPTDSIADQRVALARLFFYAPAALSVTRTVVDECAEIRCVERAELHRSWISAHFGEIPVSDPAAIQERARHLEQLHRGARDCAIVAEAEAVGFDALISFDAELKRRLTGHTTVPILEPLEYWNSLGIPADASPRWAPAQTNPLLGQNWWLLPRI